MRRSLIVLAFLVFSSMTGCYFSATAKVVDAETGEPIEGAVVLVEWTITRGLGLTYTESYKAIEAVTDKDGNAKISGEFNPFVNPPHVTAYKKGYVTWNDEYIFPDSKPRQDFEYKNGMVMRLERFKPEYTHIAHENFFHSSIHSFMNTEAKTKIKEAFRWEELLSNEERTRNERMEESKKFAPKTTQ